jgi:hypothetical protein
VIGVTAALPWGGCGRFVGRTVSFVSVVAAYAGLQLGYDANHAFSLGYALGSVLRVREIRGRGAVSPPRNSKCVGSKVRVYRPS